MPRPSLLTEARSFPARFLGSYSLTPAVARERCDDLRAANGHILHAGLTAADGRIDPKDGGLPVRAGQRAFLEGKCQKLH